MRPLTIPLVLLLGATRAASTSSSSSSRDYDAVVCGEDGYADGSGFSYSANAWNPDGDGFQCLSIANSTDESPSFDATWTWPNDPDSVHSYPHVTFSDGDLPVPLSNISALRLAADWSMGPGSSGVPPRRLDTSGLGDVGAKANVAFDMFLDRQARNSAVATKAAYEIMIWIGRVGDPQPLGFSDNDSAPCFTQQLGSYNFTLYTGENSRGTNVFTWVSPTDDMSFDEDISPLLQYLWRNQLVSADARLGLVEFGSEAYHSGNNVTFSASNFGMDVWKGTPPRYELNPVADHCEAQSTGAAVAGLVVLGGFPLWLLAFVLTQLFMG